jgi:hypothetical protein
MKKKSSPLRRRQKPVLLAPPPPPAPLASPVSALFPVVGIGASAGGLEALEHFLARVPRNSGMAFVIIQHLDPTRKGIMPELLQRATGMKVIQVKDRTVVQPDRVYVIPPNKDMSILHGVLHLLEPASPRGLRLPIDFFLRSLAQDRQEHSIGVILSGMGSDGTLGLRAIKEKAGVVLVQDPATAKFDGMPRSAIDAGLADIVAPVEDLPGRIVAYLKRTPLISQTFITADIFKTRCKTDAVRPSSPRRYRCEAPSPFALINRDPAIYWTAVFRCDGYRIPKQRSIQLSWKHERERFRTLRRRGRNPPLLKCNAFADSLYDTKRLEKALT